MADLPVREQALVHVLKALTQGELAEVAHQSERLVANEKEVGAVPTFGFTDPEDLEFGEKPKRQQKIYAVAWTWRQHKIHKTKKRCEQRLKVWKRWYERQGWTVRRMGTGYWADGPDGEKHVISLHEYDAQTRGRLS
jgi:hypothetical protein